MTGNSWKKNGSLRSTCTLPQRTDVSASMFAKNAFRSKKDIKQDIFFFNSMAVYTLFYLMQLASFCLLMSRLQLMFSWNFIHVTEGLLCSERNKTLLHFLSRCLSQSQRPLPKRRHGWTVVFEISFPNRWGRHWSLVTLAALDSSTRPCSPPGHQPDKRFFFFFLFNVPIVVWFRFLLLRRFWTASG